MEILSEKPNRQISQYKTVEIPLEIKKQVEHFFKTPKEKYSAPITSSQDIGWDKSSGYKVFKDLYSKNTNDITKFASDYCYLTGKSPFASNKLAVSAPAKK